jgi:hypothetical protein
MATYKLIQDIEAEDHIIGPLSLRQFIFALVSAFLYYICFILITKHAAFFLVLFLPPALFCTFFAIPFGRDQPTEIWALAKLRFWFKPRQRIWDQSGVKELVTITVPKKIEHVFTNGLSQTEVQSRLKVLANTLDTRGWAIKNVNVNSYSPPLQISDDDSDRLVELSKAPQEVPNYDVQAQDDILDETSNPVAQQFQSMITQSSRQHRQHLLDEMNNVSAPQTQPAGAAMPASNQWFMSGAPAQAPIGGPGVPVAGDATPEEAALAAQLKARGKSSNISNAHMRTLRPGGMSQQQPLMTTPPTTGSMTPPVGVAAPSAPAPTAVPVVAPPPMAPMPFTKAAAAAKPTTSAAAPDPAILSLATNDDLNVSTLAREAHKATGDEPPQDEVVISLH